MTQPQASSSDSHVFDKTFRIPLAEHDLAQLAEEQAALHNRREALKDKKRTALAGFKQEFAGVDDRLGVIAQEITDMQREVSIKCERVPHPNAPRWQIIRLDTHEPVDEIPMTLEEIAQTRRDSRLPLHHDGAPIGFVPDDEEELPSRGEDDEVDTSSAATEDGAGDSAGAEASGDDDQADGATAAEKPAKKKIVCTCPFVTEQHDHADPRKDVLCGDPGIARAKGFCKPHYDLTGGKNGNGTQKLALTRRTKRRQMIEDQEREDKEQEQAGAESKAKADAGELH